VPPPDSGSRYARQPTIVVVAPDGTPRTMSAPRVAPAPATAGSHEVRAGDRLDLLALAATGDTTQ
jgi:hypothetical protein